MHLHANCVVFAVFLHLYDILNRVTVVDVSFSVIYNNL